MAAQTFTAQQVAREASKVAGRTVTDKQVRGRARDIIGRFDKVKHPAYQSHAYSATERTTLVASFRKATETRSKVAKVAKVVDTDG